MTSKMKRFTLAVLLVSLAPPALAQMPGPNPAVEQTMLAYRQLSLSLDAMMKAQAEERAAVATGQKRLAEWEAYFRAYIGEPKK